jgi:hypothetical protein
VLRSREVALRRGLWVEDDVGDLAGPPLVGKEGKQFLRGATGVEVGETNGNERTVPAPLVRIKVGSGTGPISHIVQAQDPSCSRSQLFGRCGHFSR